MRVANNVMFLFALHIPTFFWSGEAKNFEIFQLRQNFIKPKFLKIQLSVTKIS